MSRFSIYLTICLLIFSCKNNSQGSGESSDEISSIDYPEVIDKMFQAHGGLDNWKKQKSLSYHLNSGEKKEIHTIDLENRKVLINGDGYDIGFDGKEVWISPDKENSPSKSPRFYHNLYFYFHSLAFLVSDPGITYEDRGIQKMHDQDFRVVAISYNANIGDAPDDEYILYLNPSTHQLLFILYTVTYYNKEKSTSFNALKYSVWEDIDGLILPSSFSGHVYEDGKIGKERYAVNFTDISLSEDKPDQDIFEMPEIAVIDTLK